MYGDINFTKNIKSRPSSSSSNDVTDSFSVKVRDKMLPRAPPHLKGRQIGMYYAKMNKIRKQEAVKEGEDVHMKPIARIYLSERKKNSIRNVLDQMPPIKKNASNQLYDNIKESSFKRAFIETITGKIEQNIEHYSDKDRRNESLDDELFKELENKLDVPKYKQMLKKRQLLPSYKTKEKIIDVIESNQVVLISGETGCGKTTQVPQFLLDHFIENQNGSLCKIVCTQPRRISAISVAERVAEERAEKLGVSSGYHIRLEKVLPRDRCSVTFCTTGVILRQMHSDPCLSEFTHIILDEIHERDTNTDFLLAILKQVMWKRKDLKIILMSATLNAENFSKYFYSCPHLNVPGFTYHVDEYFLEDVIHRLDFRYPDLYKVKGPPWKGRKIDREFFDTIDRYIKDLKSRNMYSQRVYDQLRNPASEEFNLTLVYNLIVNICQTEKDQGAILVFLTGYSHISELSKKMEQSGQFPRNRYLILPIHSQMPTVQQKEVFETPPPGVRKIILSTNIAETSITIDDVVFVIDCGWIKIKDYDSKTNTETLEPRWVAKANAAQRKGRAGRCKPGICFHLISKARYQKLQHYQLPEILRTRLESVILSAKMLQLGKIEDFFCKLMDSPDITVTKNSLDLLKKMEALDEDETLTPLGYHLAKLPMSPQIGKMILFAAVFGCLNPILNIAVCLDYKDPFLIPLGKERDADRKRSQLSNGTKSDHLMFLQMIDYFETLSYGEAKKFCWEYFLSFQIMGTLVTLKKEFTAHLCDMNFVPDKNPRSELCNLNSENLCLVRAVLTAGLYPNLIKVIQRGKRQKFYSLNGEVVDFHPKSILSNEQYIDYSLVTFYRIMKSTKTFLHDASGVSPFPVIFFGNNFQHKKLKGHYGITVNNQLLFKCTENTAQIIEELRNRMNIFLEHKVSHPDITDLRSETEDSALIRAIVELLISEELDQMELDTFEDRD